MRLAGLALVSAVVIACGTKTPAVQPPPAPTGLTATGGSGQIVLGWTASAGADSYNILRSETAGAEADYKTSAKASYTDPGLPAGKTYFYKVQAVNQGEKS